MRHYREYWIRRGLWDNEQMPLSGQNMKLVDYYQGNLLVAQTDYESAGTI